MLEVKSILYDLDGVLVDACGWHYDALNRALLEVYGFKIGRREHETTFNGLPTRVKFNKLQEQGRAREEDFSKVNSLKQMYTMEIINSLTLAPDKIELHRQVARLGIKSVCVTNAIRQTALAMLQNTGQLRFMAFVISNQNVVHPKPCGEGYVTAMVRLQSLPQETLIIEDSPRGLESARSTGARLLQVANAAEVTWENVRNIL